MKRILLIDNHDSFTWNLAELLRQNRKCTFNILQPENLEPNDPEKFDKIIFSPGPGLPDEFPVMKNILENYYTRKSVLGVCLGHQAIGVFFGARLVNLEHVVHGQVRHLHIIKPDHYIFRGIDQEIDIGLYHSWMIDKTDFPDELQILALSEDDHIMVLSHRTYDICGIQFHPESIITKLGQRIMNNWIEH